MAGRGAPSFQKRQKEQQRKEKQLEKQARKAERKRLEALGIFTSDSDSDEPVDGAEVAEGNPGEAVRDQL